MKKKRLAFLLGITPDLAFAAGNVALSLRRHMAGSDHDVIIYHPGLAPTDEAAFGRIPNCRVVRFQFPPGFAETLLAQSPPESRFRERRQLMTFCHFEAFALLAHYRTVVWLDADVAVQRSLSGITAFGPFGITTDDPWKVQGNFTTPIPGYDMQSTGVCAAVMAVQESLPFQAMHRWCYFKAIECARYLINGDQGIINLLLQEFRITPSMMPLTEWQCISWRDEANTARIVHFGTEKKVWNTASICDAFPEWYRTHLDWLELGGSDFDQRHVSPRNVLNRLNAYERMVAAVPDPVPAGTVCSSL